MTEQQINIAAAALVDGLKGAAERKGVARGDFVAMTSVAMVEIIGEVTGPVGLVSHLRDLADEIERTNGNRIA